MTPPSLVLLAAAPLLLLTAPAGAASKATVLVEDQVGDANATESRSDPMLADRATGPVNVAGADLRVLTMQRRGHVLEIRLHLEGAPVQRVGYAVSAVDDRGCDVLFTLRPSTESPRAFVTRTCGDGDVVTVPAPTSTVEDRILVQRISMSRLPLGLRGRTLTEVEAASYSTSTRDGVHQEVARWDVGRGTGTFRVR